MRFAFRRINAVFLLFVTMGASNAGAQAQGGQIAFISTRCIPYPCVALMDADGTNVMELASGLTKSTALELAWSPDGTQIVFSTLDDGTYVVPLAGGTPGRLTTHLPDSGYREAFVSWSPDGRRILFEQGNTIEVVMASDGTPITSTVQFRSGMPAWSPDGARIAFSSDRNGSSDLLVANSQIVL